MEPPGSIPNPEVKRSCADGSWTIGPVRVGRCQVIWLLPSENSVGAFFILTLSPEVEAELPEKGLFL
jgi:hypothetical protein